MKLHFGSNSSLLDRLFGLLEQITASDRLLIRLAAVAVVVTGILLILSINQDHSDMTPVRGGSITEGVVGTPRFVNPVLALTRADQDMTALIYSGLMKIDENGELANDLAESITISEDGLTYNIILRRDVTFHDAKPLTARDLAYTIRLIQDPDLKSPLRGNWSNVTIEEVGEYELNVILEEAYAPFIENFTVGIMPAHAWSSLPIEQLPFSQLNTEPIGSGPFLLTTAKRDTSGLISNYTLTAFRENGDNPNIDTLQFIFFSNEDQLLEALQRENIDTTAYISNERVDQVLTDDYRLVEEPLPRTFGVFFNQNRSAALRDAGARKALASAIDRTAIIDVALQGHGVPTWSPTISVAPTLESGDSIVDSATGTPATEAIAILKNSGWSKNTAGLWEKQIDKETVTLTIVIRTSNTPLFSALADKIAEQWKAIGVDVTTEQFEQTGLVQSVIRPRDFEALLFGLDMSRSYDLYPFWHSSQQDDPGLNIAQYANVEVDKLLEKARTEQQQQLRLEALQAASAVIMDEDPAVFLFQPNFTYIVAADISTAPMRGLGRPADRFSNIADWHTETDSLWPIFRDEI